MDKKQEFLKKLVATFKIEAEENIKIMTADLMELEKNPKDSRKSELIEIIFRATHSLKGASRAVNLVDVESVCQSFEGVMSHFKDKGIQLTPEIFDVLHQTIDILDDIINLSGAELDSDLKSRKSNILKNLLAIAEGKLEEIKLEKPATTETTTPIVSQTKEIIEEKPEVVVQEVKHNSTDTKDIKYPKAQRENDKSTRNASTETIRVSTKKLDNLLFQTEDMLSVKLSSIQQSENLRMTLDKISIWNKEASEVFSAIRIIKQIQEKKEKEGFLSKEEQSTAKIIQFYDWGISHIKMLEDDLNKLKNFSDQEVYATGAKIETLLDDVKEIITVPFFTILDVFPKTVRDLSKEMGKDIDFLVEGDDTEIDRRILEELRVPLLHLLRNSIDYGIEKPKIRISKKKAKTGKIIFNIERLENSKIRVVISDDGAGINIQKLRDLYIENEKVSTEEVEEIPIKELLQYIFRSGVSTSEIVTDISGRGLGLAIVQEKIEQLGGSITVESEPDMGTIFKIELPLSLVTFRGVLITLSEKEFIVPTSKIQRVLRLNKKDVKTVENKATMSFDGRVIPFVRLSNILELPNIETDSEFVQTIIFGTNGHQMGFAIDEIIDEQEVLVKGFNKHLARIKNISGATVLGSGQVVPILNIADLLKSANTSSASVVTHFKPDENEEDQKSIIVVEDSITSRMLLKNILETEGYKVTTAIDGVDGFTKIKESTFDAVVSDIEMPRMNGFDLTAKIRADNGLAEIPIILVTSLSKREDRERGIDVGANAYIIKSSFDQSNLLEILERLI